VRQTKAYLPAPRLTDTSTECGRLLFAQCTQIEKQGYIEKYLFIAGYNLTCL